MNLDHETCAKCQQYSEEFNRKDKSLCVHLEVTSFNKRLDEKEHKLKNPDSKQKRKKKDEIKHCVTAIRNSSGGHLLIHLEGLSPQDLSQGNLDEFIDDDLQAIINADETFDDVYFKETFHEDHEFVIIDIQPSSTIIISDPKTKFIIDKGFIPDSSQALRLFLKQIPKQQDSKDSDKQRPPYVNDQTLPTLRETRDIQLKGFEFHPKEKDKKEKLLRGPQEFVDHLWILRLPLYVSAFAKLKRGGSFILGVAEKEQIFPTIIKGRPVHYVSKTFEAHGIELPSDKHTVFQESIERRLKEHMCLIDCEGVILDWPDRHISVHFHKADPKVDPKVATLLEVVVNPITGLLFYDNKGPEAYKIESGNHRKPFLKYTRCELKEIITSLKSH